MAGPEDNKKLVRDFFETVVNKREVGALPRFVAEDGTCGGKAFRELVINPDPTSAKALGSKRIVPEADVPGGRAKKSDVAVFQDFTKHVLDAFPDMKVQIQSLVAEGDQVVVRWRSRGTHRGEFLGARATGRVVPMTNIDIFTIKGDKIVGVVSQPDTAGVLKALGHLPDTPLAAVLGAGIEDQK